MRIKSHNYSSAIDSYHGAVIAVGDIIRNILTMGGIRPIALLNYLRFGRLIESNNRYWALKAKAGKWKED